MNAATTTHMSQWTSLALPRTSLRNAKVTKPAPTPLVIEYVNGMTTMVSRAGRPSSMSVKSILEAMPAMRKPTMTSAGAVASGGITATTGARNIARRNSTPVVTLARPVRAPAETPAADSMYVVLLDAPMSPPNAAPMESMKSDSMIVKTARIAASGPRIENALKFSPLKLFEKSGACNQLDGSWAVPGAVEGT